MIKKLTSLQQSVQVGTQIVEYTWIQQQEELYLPQHNQWKQIIVDNFEIFMILMVFVYCVTFYFMYKAFSKKNTQVIVQMRKESSASDDQQSSNRQSTEQNELRRRDNSSSTESSPRCAIQDAPLNVIALPDHEIPLFGHKISEQREEIIEWQKDEKDNTITHIQTRKVIQKVKANDEQLQQIKSQKIGINQQNATGVRLIQQEFADGKPEQIIQILTDWSRFCENGKFEKMYSAPKLIGKGTFGEVFKCQKIVDLREYAVKRVYFKVRHEKTLRDHPIFREINVHQEINHKNIVRYYTSWIQELTNEMITEISKLHQMVAEKQQNFNESNQNSYKPQLMDDMSYLNDCVQFVGGNTENEQQIQTVLSKQSKTIASFHLSDYSSQIQSRMRRFHFSPDQKDDQYQLFMLYIEMELCDYTLKDFIDRVDRKGEKVLIKSIFIQILEGIIFMHSKKFIHRDLKPQNIFINSQNEVKIGDLGLTNSALFKVDEDFSSTATSGEYTNNIGTPMYMAPEVKDDVYGQPADIFALGIILFEMLWKIKTSYEKMRLIQGLTKDSILPPDLFKEHPVEADLILRMVNKSPQLRPTAQQILDTLNKQ